MPSRISLSLAMGQGPAVTPVPAELAEALLSAEVKVAVGSPSGFQLEFAVSKKSIISRALLPGSALDPGTRVMLSAIVNGLPHMLMDGIVTRQDLKPAGEPGASTITLTGQDHTVLMDMDETRKCFPAMPAMARVALICAQPKYAMYGIVPAPVPPFMIDVPNPVERVPVQAGMTDLAYINALGAEVGHVFYIDPVAPGVNVAYWGPEVRVGLVQHALNVNLGPATNVDDMTFSYDGLARTQLTVNILEPHSKVTIPVPIPEVSILKPPLAARPAITLKSEVLPETAKLNPVVAAMLGLARQSNAADAVTGQGKLNVLRYGHVLKARHLVGVRGAGPAYDGTYYVTSVTHNLKRGEYTQSFSLARDSLVAMPADRVLP